MVKIYFRNEDNLMGLFVGEFSIMEIEYFIDVIMNYGIVLDRNYCIFKAARFVTEPYFGFEIIVEDCKEKVLMQYQQ